MIQFPAPRAQINGRVAFELRRFQPRFFTARSARQALLGTAGPHLPASACDGRVASLEHEDDHVKRGQHLGRRDHAAAAVATSPLTPLRSMG